MGNWSDITTPRGYATSYFRIKNRKNAFQNTNEFRVIALTPPIRYSGPAPSGNNSDVASKYWFVGRILDKKMSHYNFLENPCAQSTTGDESAALMLQYLHAKIILSTSGEEPDFAAGDVVVATIEPGDRNVIYGLQFMKFMRVEDKDNDMPSVFEYDCKEHNYDWATGTALGGVASGRGNPVPTKCGSAEFCNQRVVASYYTPANRGADDIRMIVIHATAGAGRAIAGAKWMAGSPTSKVRANKAYKDSGKPLYDGKYEACHSGTCKSKGKPYQEKPTNSSAHYYVDQGGDVVEVVPPEDRAWHASGANGHSIGIEHTGDVDDPAVWTDTLYRTSAQLSAGLAAKFNIPIKQTTDHKGSGFLAHSDVPQKKPHHDPGIHFDWDKYIKLVQEYYNAGNYATGDKPEPVAAAPDAGEPNPEHSTDDGTAPPVDPA